MAVGETHELAPRDPDPEGTYDWSVADAPEESDVAFGEDPIAYITPDEPGTYNVRIAHENRALHVEPATD